MLIKIKDKIKTIIGYNIIKFKISSTLQKYIQIAEYLFILFSIVWFSLNASLSFVLIPVITILLLLVNNYNKIKQKKEDLFNNYSMDKKDEQFYNLIRDFELYS